MSNLLRDEEDIVTNGNNVPTQPGSSALERPYFSPGLLLEDDDLNAGVTYTRELTRLLFRSFFGCGIVCGLGVTAKLICNRQTLSVTVEPGLALDGMGNPIHVRSSMEVGVDAKCGGLPAKVWVALCYRQVDGRPKLTACGASGDSQTVRTRACDCFDLKLFDTQPVACSCAASASGVTGHNAGGGSEDAAGTDPEPQLAASPLVAAAHTSRGRAPDCSCYDAHNRGSCAWDCGCNCVLLAVLKVQEAVDKPQPAKCDATNVDLEEPSPRRLIRPVLTGSLPCLQAEIDDHKKRITNAEKAIKELQAHPIGPKIPTQAEPSRLAQQLASAQVRAPEKTKPQDG